MWIAGVVVCFGWLFSLCFHEFSHALVAYWGGDTTVKNKGYLTFNLFKYTQPGSSLILPLMFILIGGLALPGGAVYINNSLLRDRFWSSLVSAAGPFSNVLFAFLLIIPLKLFSGDIELDKVANNYSFISITGYSFSYLIYLQVFAILFNLIPIPPFDGYGIVEPWLPINIKNKLTKYSNYGYYFILGLFFFVPTFSSFFFGGIRNVCSLLGVSEVLIFQGQRLFFLPINKLIAIIIILTIGYMLRFNEHTWYQKGNSLQKRGKSEKAIDAYEKAIGIRQDYADAWLEKANSLFDLKKYEEAIESYQEVIKIEPEHHNAWINLGHLYRNLNNYEEAIAAYQQAIELKDINDSESDSTFERLSYLLFYCKREEEAISILDRGINLISNNKSLRIQKADYLYRMQRYQGMIETCDQGLNIYPDNMTLKYYLGLALQKLERDTEAKDIFAEILALNPDNDLALSGQASIYYSEKNYTAAIDNHQKIVEVKPDNSAAWYNLACCYALQENSSQTIAALKRAIEIDPSNKALAKNDKDFASLQDNREFQALITIPDQIDI